MTYEQLEKVNEKIKTTELKNDKTGKKIGDYAEVNQRIKAFRMLYPEGTIKTTMVSNENGVCIFRAEIYSNEFLLDNEMLVQRLLATGTAYEKEGSTFINKTSYIENCETSAVGRALGMLGLGIDTSIASKEEVENARLQQEETINYKQALMDKLNELGIDPTIYAKEHHVNGKTTQDEAKALLEELCKQ